MARTATKGKAAAGRVTWSNWRDELRADMEAAAKGCGCDLTGLRFESFASDRTWGDRMALAFFGAAEDVCRRAADFFVTWGARHLQPLSSVGAQVWVSANVRPDGAVRTYTFRKFANGASGWSEDGDTTVIRATYEGAPALVEEVHAPIAVDYVYFPCAD